MKKKKYITPAISNIYFNTPQIMIGGSAGTDDNFAKQFDFSGIEFDEMEDKEWSMWTYQPFEDLAENDNWTY